MTAVWGIGASLNYVDKQKNKKYRAYLKVVLKNKEQTEYVNFKN